MRGFWTFALAALASCGELYEVPDASSHATDARTDAPVPVGSDLVLDFHMDSLGSGATCVIDSASEHHDGSCGDSPPEQIFNGVVGNAFHFASASDPTVHSEGFTLVPTEELAQLPEYTVSVWLRMQLPLVSDYECMINRIYDNMEGDSWQICLGGTDPNGIALFANQDEPIAGEVGSDAWSDGLYHHVGLTYGSAGHTLYFDGALVGSGAGVEFAGPNDLISIGRDFDPPTGSDTESGGSDLVPSAGYQGDMDELRIYKRLLSAEEIMDLVLHPTGS